VAGGRDPAGILSVASHRAAKTVLPLVSAAIVVNGLQGTYLHLLDSPCSKPCEQDVSNRVSHAFHVRKIEDRQNIRTAVRIWPTSREGCRT
jgi:hypothetical protein